MTAVLDAIVDFEILLTAAGLLTFVFSYSVFFNWTKTPAGRSLLYFVISLLALVSVSVIRVFTDSQSDAFIFARGFVYTIMVFTTWHLVLVLWKNYRHSPKDTLSPYTPTVKEVKE